MISIKRWNEVVAPVYAVVRATMVPKPKHRQSAEIDRLTLEELKLHVGTRGKKFLNSANVQVHR